MKYDNLQGGAYVPKGDAAIQLSHALDKARRNQTMTDDTREIIKATPEDAGCYVDGHWGNYAIAHMIERATEWGFTDNKLEALAAKHLASMGPSDSEPLTDTEWEAMSDSADEVENWLNEHVAPEGYYWYWNDGEFFLGTTDDDEEDI